MAKKATPPPRKKAAKKARAKPAEAPPTRAAPKRAAAKKAKSVRARKPVPAPAPPPRSPAQKAAIKAARQAADKQVAAFEKAVVLFQKRKFGRAKPLLEQVANGPEAGLGHRARIYLQICDEQSAPAAPKPRTVEDHYNYAVQLINDRDLDAAEQHLRKALRLDKKAAHAHYALAVVRTLAGDTSSAYQALKTAVDIDPQNRIVALRDPDLAAVVRDEPFAALLSTR